MSFTWKHCPAVGYRNKIDFYVVFIHSYELQTLHVKIKKLSDSGSQPHLLMIDRYVMGMMIYRFVVMNLQICVCLCVYVFIVLGFHFDLDYI